MEKDKLILVFYINVENMSTDDIGDYMNKISQKIVPTNIDAEGILIPIFNGLTRIECINPKYISEDDLIKKNNILMGELNEHLKYELNNIKENK